MSKLHIKKGDTVVVLSGDDAKKKGKVISVLPDEGKVIVEGVNMVTKHKKPRSATQPGGLVHQEAPIRACSSSAKSAVSRPGPERNYWPTAQR